jgi:predicted transcriptional regulator
MRRTKLVSITRPISTTQMQVTSIRLERDLKEKLKALAGPQGYQTLIRDVLWDYVQAQSQGGAEHLRRSHISASIAATAHSEVLCALTGQLIQPQEPMLLGLTGQGELVPLSVESLVEAEEEGVKEAV